MVVSSYGALGAIMTLNNVWNNFPNANGGGAGFPSFGSAFSSTSKTNVNSLFNSTCDVERIELDGADKYNE